MYCSRECNKRGYYRENKEMFRARGRAWVEANPEKRREHLARFAESHPDYGKERYTRLKANPERFAAAQERGRRYYQEHRGEVLERVRLQRERWPTRGYNGRHGCDWEELFAQLWLAQDGKCYLCEDPLDRDAYRAIHLDHDHSCCPLGKSCAVCRRGLACRRCNVLIGWVDHDPGRLRLIADNLDVANTLFRQRRKEADQEKRGVLFDLEEPALRVVVAERLGRDPLQFPVCRCLVRRPPQVRVGGHLPGSQRQFPVRPPAHRVTPLQHVPVRRLQHAPAVLKDTPVLRPVPHRCRRPLIPVRGRVEHRPG
jgi:Recombination endonuclease VII